jgi:hypothetical protein
MGSSEGIPLEFQEPPIAWPKGVRTDMKSQQILEIPMAVTERRYAETVARS